MRNTRPVALAFGVGIWALVLAPGELAQTQPPQVIKGPAHPTASVAGSDTYREYCAACHGIGGRGNGPAAPALKIPPTDLTMLTKTHEGKFPEMSIRATINGDNQKTSHGSTDMPVWGPIFNGLEDKSVTRLRIANLIRYIKAFQVLD